jgi:copper(I)-binding protein
MRVRLLTFALLFSAALAARADGITVRDAWVREAPPGAPVLAAYLTLENTGARAVKLTRVTSPDFESVMLHQTRVREGVATMVAVDTLTVPAQGRAAFVPGGDHLMLHGPRRALAAGARVTFHLHFDSGATLTVDAPVRRDAPAAHHH